MVTERFSLLLSPPNSPRMSDAEAKTSQYYNQYASYPSQHHPNPSTQQNHQGRESPSSSYDAARPGLRSHKSFPVSLRHASVEHFDERYAPQSGASMSSAGPTPAIAGHSAPGSPADQLTPRSDGNSARDQQDEDDEVIEMGGDEQDDEAENRPMTAAELRAAKRKMKRFRLTHSQTRFLMSEFARQAHPDAAHRERLAREIPGLSARQVQVWFQNRRAKLKRLTTDDRERMMSSRAVPANFDTAQALHSPFGAQVPTMVGSVSAVGDFPHYGHAGAVRPLGYDTLRRVPDYEQYSHSYGTPSGVSPALGAFTLGSSQAAPEHISPTSAGSGMSPFLVQHQQPYERGPPNGLPSASHAGYPQQPPLSRAPLPDRIGRTFGEHTASPLRSSVSYSALGSVSSQQPHHFSERPTPYSEPAIYGQPRPYLQRSTSGTAVSDSGSYGLGFSYTHAPAYQQSEPQQPPASGNPHNPQPTATEQFPRSALPVTAYGQYQPYQPTSQMPQYQGFTAHYPPQGAHGEYPPMGQGQQSAPAQEHSQHHNQSSYQPLPSATQQYIALGNTSDGQQVTASQGPAHGGSVPPPY
ncbi:uncharacterized protein CLAFUR5_10496 [Fulvia fulva]|uniref:Homeobox domain-containing protein n=1 Tax=Passalora fulva TaxID=5499 RepID=A0A9Q8PCW1_PASFU|nr:uncharacterized protein CLAFUR5_10496 [Fulvia fulva]KAK4620529.1 hypothetical protein CLAFUR0_11467 [Fulvia fulva]UJO20115.1 hypothetical protein CLAFUR5_10496 [Fulvia fulva]